MPALDMPTLEPSRSFAYLAGRLEPRRAGKPALQLLKKIWRVGWDAFWQFNADDGWAIASHIALSSLMAMFPFFLVLTALAGMFGSQYLADEAANLVLEAWPEEVAGPISREIHNVLVGAHGQVLTVGVAARAVFRIERHREPAHRPQPRLHRGGDPLAGGCCGSNRSAMSCWPRSGCWPCRSWCCWRR